MNKGLFSPENFLKTFWPTEQTVNRRLPQAALCFIVAFILITTWIDQVMESTLAFSGTNCKIKYSGTWYFYKSFQYEYINIL